MATANEEVWRPGSFTKNFSWGDVASGLSELHAVIRMGFNDELEDVPRDVFRERVSLSGRPDYIPMNFFLFNRVENGENLICVDELVFQALSWNHNPAFDRLALFAFIFSYAGKWKSASKEQRRPAMWANAYVRNRLAHDLGWNVRLVTADDIQAFVSSDPRYMAETSRKLATNLNYLLHTGDIGEFSNAKVTRWWVDCVFLALDRVLENALIDGRSISPREYEGAMQQSGFYALTGDKNSEKVLAMRHLIRLYEKLGGRSRFIYNDVIDRTRELLGIQPQIPNDERPKGAIHRTNPRIFKSIPPICADLARSAGFDVISAVDVDGFDDQEFIRTKTETALAVLRERGIEANMTVEEFLKLTRDE